MSSTWILVAAVFLASAVEAVEALTIILASGITLGWRSTLEGVAAALGVLVVLVALLGVTLATLVPLDALRLVIGILLLVFGLQWLRKAVLRAGGRIPLHDEDRVFRRESAQLEELSNEPASKRNATAFVVSFKGVFLEGLEVAVIVITLGAPSHRLRLAAAAAGAAVLVVAVAGLVLRRQLAQVPENALKMGVGIMLSAFGTFWMGEGAGVRWPGEDAFIVVLVTVLGTAAALLVALLRRHAPTTATAESS